ncbi:MAG TPA: winged helix-turn-helix domain-containing protein [Hyphomonadaceae bacterium]|jgi:DNA-binding winged helix-turn-helix (wHTH) protein/TolB-like protein|nr:winged helix-turn-helix domain-containing protein [Hyphomonadaceae bacterium]
MTAEFRAEQIDLAREKDFRLGGLLVRPSTLQIESDTKSGGESGTLEPRIMQVLVALARKRGQVVSRDELIAACWEGRIVGDDALNRCISKIRKLGETNSDFRLETVPRVGYRLSADDAQAAELTATQAAQDSNAAIGPGRRRIPMIAWTMIGALAVAAAVSLFLFVRSPPASQRVAFFGFTATDDNPVSARIAADATDQTFTELTRMRLDAAAKTDTLSPSATDRLTRAKALGAAYALSGEVRTVGEEAQFAIRLEDTATRATLWESGETAPIARPLYSPSKQAAFRAAGSTACVSTMRSELTHESSEALRAISGYCARPFSPTAGETAVLDFRTLVKLEPCSVFFKTSLASQLVFGAIYSPAGLKDKAFGEADALLAESLQIKPANSYSIAISEFLLTARGGSPLERQKLLATARPSGWVWGDGFLSYRLGLNLLGNGLTKQGIAVLKAAEAAQPTFTQVAAFHAYGLASQGQAADAELLFEQVFASEPGHTLVWPTWAMAAVLEGVGDPEAMLAAAPENEPRASVACWRTALEAKRAGKPGPPPDSLRDCGSTPFILAALGRVDEAFDFIGTSPGQSGDGRSLFTPSASAMRASDSFMPLVKELGLWEYWIATDSHPDVCDLPQERNFKVCADLRTLQTK